MKIEVLRQLLIEWTNPWGAFFSAPALAEQLLKYINDEPVDSWFQSYMDDAIIVVTKKLQEEEN